MQNSMNVPIFNGNTIVLMTRWDIDTALFYIKKYKIKSWRSITASIIDLVSEFKPLKHNIASLISVGGGGASMPKPIAMKLKKLTNLDYIEAYGLTETMAPTHINPPHKTKLGSIGIPIFNVDARIIDIDKNTELGVNQVGELIISSPQLFLGYLNNDNNHKYFIRLDNKNFFKTGDLAYFDKDGYFFVVDRLKRMINSSGYKIWPAEIEKILHSFEGIKEVCVIGVPDLRSGQKVKAIIVPENSHSEKKITNLKQWCSSRMAKYKIPKIFEIRKSLPKNKMGKIMWRELK
jgi:fatty-acyl-CoA synthase